MDTDRRFVVIVVLVTIAHLLALAWLGHWRIKPTPARADVLRVSIRVEPIIDKPIPNPPAPKLTRPTVAAKPVHRTVAAEPALPALSGGANGSRGAHGPTRSSNSNLVGDAGGVDGAVSADLVEAVADGPDNDTPAAVVADDRRDSDSRGGSFSNTVASGNSGSAGNLQVGDGGNGNVGDGLGGSGGNGGNSGGSSSTGSGGGRAGFGAVQSRPSTGSGLPYGLAPPRPGPRHVVYVLDCSPSMSSKLAGARRELLDALLTMGDGDTFNIVRFGNDASAMAPQMVPVTDHQLAFAREYLSHVAFLRGGTNLEQAVVLALTLAGATEIVVVTDGMPTEGEDGPHRFGKMIARQAHGIHVHAVALVDTQADSREEIADATTLLAGLATATGGASRVVDVARW